MGFSKCTRYGKVVKHIKETYTWGHKLTKLQYIMLIYLIDCEYCLKYNKSLTGNKYKLLGYGFISLESTKYNLTKLSKNDIYFIDKIVLSLYNKTNFISLVDEVCKYKYIDNILCNK